MDIVGLDKGYGFNEHWKKKKFVTSISLLECLTMEDKMGPSEVFVNVAIEVNEEEVGDK